MKFGFVKDPYDNDFHAALFNDDCTKYTTYLTEYEVDDFSSITFNEIVTKERKAIVATGDVFILSDGFYLFPGASNLIFVQYRGDWYNVDGFAVPSKDTDNYVRIGDIPAEWKCRP